MTYLSRPLVFALLILFVVEAGQAQVVSEYWEPLPNSPHRINQFSRHDDIFFISATTGWIVNLSGEIFHTVDGGATWVQQADLSVPLRSVGFASEQVGWAGTLDGEAVLFETRDGGATWTDITDQLGNLVPEGICGLWVVNEQVVYGVGQFNGPPRLIKTTDGGVTWSGQDLSSQIGTLVDVYFFDEQRGVIVGGSNPELREGNVVVLMTEDGGATWQVRHQGQSTDGEWGWKIAFPTPTTGYVSVESFEPGGRLLKTTDGGQTWHPLFIAESTPLQGIGFGTATLGWVSGRGQTWQTEDGGATWQQIELDGRINRFRLFGDSLGYAVGNHVSRFSPTMPTALEEQPPMPHAFRLEQNHPNPFSGVTTVSYVLSRAAEVSLVVYDVLGRRITTLVEEQQQPDIHRIDWDGTTEANVPVASGVYIYLLRVGEHMQSGTMLLVRN